MYTHAHVMLVKLQEKGGEAGYRGSVSGER